MAHIKKRMTDSGPRYDVRWRADGRPSKRTFKLRADAEAYRRTIESNEMRGIVVDPRRERLTVTEVAAEWLASNPAKVARTLEREETTIRLHITPALGAKRLSQVTPSMVQALVNEWATERAPRSVARDYRTLNAICNFAIQRDYLGRTPCRGIKLPAADRVGVHLIEPDELHVIADAMGRYGLMAHIGAQLGLRWGEIAGLRTGSIDLGAGTVTVDEQVTRGTRGKVLLGRPKTEASRRTLSLGSWLTAALTTHMTTAGTLTDLDALLFPAPEGGPLSYSNWFRRVWTPALDRLATRAVVSALRAAHARAIAEALADGAVTTDEATARTVALAGTVDALIRHAGHQPSGAVDTLTAAATALGMKPADLRADLDAGRSILDVARNRAPKLRFHDLRRASATYLVLSGVDPKTLQNRLGHTDARMTLELYAQATSEGDRRAAEALADRLAPRPA